MEAPRVLSVVATRFRDLDLADEAVQDALTEAARTWNRNGVPDNPGGWLMRVAQRRAIDVYRRRQREHRRFQASAADIYTRQSGDASVADDGTTLDDPQMTDADTSLATADERLRLILLCCHPALDRHAQVALTLRLVSGLTVSEISRAFLVPEPTLAQRIVRAKRKITTAKIPLSIPSAIEERLDSVLTVLYLVFNEGYLSNSSGHDPIRSDLVDEAIRLTEIVSALAPDSAEALGLLALERFHRARAGGRFDQGGDIVLLADQDRAAWNLVEINAANSVLASAMAKMRPGRFQLEALIAGEHANARTAADTDWPQIARLYAQLEAMSGSPIVGLNHAVAVAESDGPLAGLVLLDQLDGLDGYHLFWATRAELHRRAGSTDAARSAYERALGLDPSAAERRHVERRLRSLPGPHC